MFCCIILTSTSPAFRFFFFNDTATTEIYTLSLHDALPISGRGRGKTDGLVGAWKYGASLAWDHVRAADSSVQLYCPSRGLYLTRRRSDRSEERRVGKECRSRWSPYH